ncbi:MAG: hypothetical protein QXD48_01150 [Candidatus Aenigmatarchaeota archaeon]
MDFNNLNTNRNNFSGLLIIMFSGIIFGFGALFVKLAITQTDILKIILCPISWLALIFAISGFVLMQKTMHDEYVSIVVPTVTGIATMISVFFAFIFLSESISTIRWIGIFLILIGIFILCVVKRK